MITFKVYRYAKGKRELYATHQYPSNLSENAMMNIIEAISWLGYEPELE